MGKTIVDISMSLDGYVAGPSPSLEDPLGIGGERLHEWVIALEAWRRPHGREGGETTASSELIERRLAAVGATVMGRKMYSGGSGPWADDPRASGWWGDTPPFGHPVFVLTHHAREPLALQGTTFTFVTDGIESALEQARAAAGDKDVAVAGGAEAIQQCLAAGLVDELQLNVVPTLLGSGARLLDNLDADGVKLKALPVVDAPGVTHLRYAVG